MNVINRQGLHRGTRLLLALVLGLAALALAGCPFSNYSGPSTANSPPAAGTSPSVEPPGTPPPTQPPVEPPAASTVPPPASTAPGAPLPLPMAVDGTLTVEPGQTATGTLKGSGQGTLSYAIVVPAASGTATLLDAADGAFSYTPNAKFVGNDQFQFTLTDSAGTSRPATMRIAVTAPVPGAQVVANIGVNTDWVCYWCKVQPYVDVTRQAANFGDLAAGGALASAGKVDANGWPTQDFRWMVLCCAQASGGPGDPGPGNPLAGDYHLSFNGKATLTAQSFQVKDQLYDAASNTTTATLALSLSYTGGHAMLYFANTQRTANAALGTGVTNIHIIRPQFGPNGVKWWDSPNQEFTQPFLDLFKGVSTIRYMNWTHVIASPEVDWSDRTPGYWPVAEGVTQAAASSLPYLLKPAATCTRYCDWYTTGQPWESAIDVANATRTDMWINVPVMASDAYVKSLASLIKSRLDASLHVYVEWSNEIWNFGAPYWTETNYNRDQTGALVASDPVAAAHYAANCVSWARNMCHVAERLKQISDIFATVDGAGAINTRVRPVLCMQFVQPVYQMAALRFIALTYGAPNRFFYGTCGGVYWHSESKLTADSSVADVVAALDGAIAGVADNVETDTAIDLHYGLHNLSYEGGPSLPPKSGPSTEVLDAVQMAPGMQANVANGLGTFFTHGGDMFMYYAIGGASTFGATTDPLDLHEPKLAALQASMGQPVARRAGTILPGTVETHSPVFALDDDTPVATSQMQNCGPNYCAIGSTIAVGNGYGYLATATQAGTYAVTLGLASTKNAAARLELRVDDRSVGFFDVAQPSPTATPTANTLSVPLTAGVHVIALLNASTTGGAAPTGLSFALN